MAVYLSILSLILMVVGAAVSFADVVTASILFLAGVMALGFSAVIIEIQKLNKDA